MLLKVLLLVVVSYASGVVQLTDNNFYAYAQTKDVLLVDFYAPWCSDCTKLAPEFEEAGSALGPRSADLAKVDCFGDGKGLCQMYGVKSWPQLKNFHRGTYTGDYSGDQSAGAIANYINTVENSAMGAEVQAATNTNPYAMAYPASQAVPAAAGPSISSSLAARPKISTSMACAKCNIAKHQKSEGGKIDKHCSESFRKACIEKLTAAQKKYGADD